MEAKIFPNAIYKENQNPNLPLSVHLFSVLINTDSKFSYLLYYKLHSQKNLNNHPCYVTTDY